MNKLDFPSENFIENYLISKIDADNHCVVADEEVDGAFRQVDLGSYGIADIVKFIWHPDMMVITVMELKNETLKPAHLAQLCRYVTCVKNIAKRYQRFINIEVYGELVGPFEKSNDLPYLINHIDENISVYDLRLSLDSGVVSDGVGRGWYKDDKASTYFPVIKKSLRVIRDVNDA